MPDPQAPEIAALADALRKLCERFGADDPEDEDTDIQAGLDAIAAYETSTTLPIAPQETMREALKLAANRLHRCAIDHPMGSREQIERSEWAQEARAALGQSHSPATVERELVEALRPFAELADSFSDTFGDNLKLSMDESNNGDSTYAFTLGDLRRADKALATANPEPEPGCCELCGAAPVNENGLCATCVDELTERAPELAKAAQELLDAYSAYFGEGKNNPWGDKLRKALATASQTVDGEGK